MGNPDKVRYIHTQNVVHDLGDKIGESGRTRKRVKYFHHTSISISMVSDQYRELAFAASMEGFVIHNQKKNIIEGINLIIDITVGGLSYR